MYRKPLLKCYKIGIVQNIACVFDNVSFYVCLVQLWSPDQLICLQMQLWTLLSLV